VPAVLPFLARRRALAYTDSPQPVTPSTSWPRPIASGDRSRGEAGFKGSDQRQNEFRAACISLNLHGHFPRFEDVIALRTEWVQQLSRRTFFASQCVNRDELQLHFLGLGGVCRFSGISISAPPGWKSERLFREQRRWTLPARTRRTRGSANAIPQLDGRWERSMKRAGRDSVALGCIAGLWRPGA